MKRSLAGSLLPVLLCLFAWCSEALGNTDELVKKVQPATVMVVVYDQAGKVMGQGSGFMFNAYGHLITNYHVLGKAAMAKVRTGDGREFNIKAIVAQDAADDLIEAIVDITTGSLPYLRPAGVAPKPGDPVVAIGSPYGVSRVISEGNVTAIQEVPKYGKSIIHTAHSFPGSSGSPLVNDRGEVVGIGTAAVPGKADVNLAVPVERFSGLSPHYRQLQAARPPASTTPKVDTKKETAGKDVRLSEPSDPAAQVKLGMMYEQGRGVPGNCFEALSLYRKAAEKGFAPAQYHIGRMYYEGTCSGRNPGEAAKWLRTAAERGVPDAQKLYGSLCFNGEGVPRDRVGGCMWTILAASGGHQEASRVLRLMNSELTPAELKAAKEKAANWKPAR